MAINYRPLALTTPSGQRFEFLYNGELEDGKTHNLGEFTFSGQDEKYFQDKSITSDSFPFTILLRDQDVLKTVRTAFDEKKTDTADFILEHPDPSLGTFPVVVSNYKVSQNSVKGRGIIRVSVVFFKTITNLLGGDPTESTNPSSAGSTLTAIDELNIDQATDFENSVNLDFGSAIAALSERTIGAVNTITDSLSAMASVKEEISTLFNNTAQEILTTIDTIVLTPFDLARQMQNLIQLPMLAIDDPTQRIATYSELLTSLTVFSQDDETEFTSGSPSGLNILSGAGLFALATVSAINYSAVSTSSVTLEEIVSGEPVSSGYISRNQIIETIDSILNTALNVTETFSEKSSNFGAETFFTQYFDYSILNKNLIAATVKNLNNRVFNTSREITIVTDQELTPIQWCANLYQSVELNTVVFFNDSNNIRGDEIFLVPKNREVVYYR